MSKDRKTKDVYRSAKDGRFVKEKYAITHPDTTVKHQYKK